MLIWVLLSDSESGSDRLRDAHVALRSLLDDAMQRTGARSELEAIVAGLRSLRAPSPRQVEPDIAR